MRVSALEDGQYRAGIWLSNIHNPAIRFRNEQLLNPSQQLAKSEATHACVTDTPHACMRVDRGTNDEDHGPINSGLFTKGYRWHDEEDAAGFCCTLLKAVLQSGDPE